MKAKLKNYLQEAIYLFLISFFCYTSINKYFNLESFRTNLIKTSLFDISTAEYFSVFVIVWELIVVLVLLFMKNKGLLLFTVTILIFTLYISYLKSRGLYEVCGCGGILNGLEYTFHLTINIFLMFSSSYLWLINYTKNEK